MIGKHIEDRFRIKTKLGEGAIATVYQAEEIYSGRDVALKVLKPDQLDPAFRERFLREAKSQAMLKNPHVARVFHFGRDLSLGVLYIVLEYIPGDTLNRLVNAGRLPTNLAVQIALQVSNGLVAAHEAGVIHRDLKPANIMLRPRDNELRAKILDFGFARPMKSDVALTDQGMTAGTLSYISPEQLRMEDPTPHIDMYSFGVVFFEMLTGRPLFLGQTPQATAIMHMSESAPLLSDVLDGASLALEALLASMLEKHAKDRPASMSEVEATLKMIWDDEGLKNFTPSHEGACTNAFLDWGVLPACS